MDDLEWSTVVDVSKWVGFEIPKGQQYTNEFVVTRYLMHEDSDGRRYYSEYWYVSVYDGWNGKRSGMTREHQLPKNWILLDKP